MEYEIRLYHADHEEGAATQFENDLQEMVKLDYELHSWRLSPSNHPNHRETVIIAVFARPAPRDML